jgi:nicotinate phosphoribosyltransferase
MTNLKSPIFTDLYELTMMQVWFQNDMARTEACFDLFFRKCPFEGEYVIAAGIDDALSFLKDAYFSEDEISYLKSLDLFEETFLELLSTWKFDGSVYAIKEGSVVFPNEPVMRIHGPIISCQLIETALLNIVNFESLIATKSSRVCSVAGWDNVLEFGARRAQGPDGALSASKSAYIGGCAATSNLEAGMKFGIPVRGTHAHSFVMSFDSEIEAFRRYADSYPDATILLIDTYNTINYGLPHAILVGKEMERSGNTLAGVRLDSGDLLSLSKETRRKLDEAGMYSTKIVASGDLDEYIISTLTENKAPIDTYGVGTRLVTGFDSPALAGVYKLSALKNPDGTVSMRLKITNGEDKQSLPGIKQIYRTYDEKSGIMLFDTIDLESKVIPGVNTVPLLSLVLSDGVLTSDFRNVHEIREDFIQVFNKIPEKVRRISDPEQYLVKIGSTLKSAQKELQEQYISRQKK